MENENIQRMKHFLDEVLANLQLLSLLRQFFVASSIIWISFYVSFISKNVFVLIFPNLNFLCLLIFFF